MFKVNNWIKRTVVLGLVAGAALFASTYLAGAATAPTLGAAQSFAVLAGSTVTIGAGATTIGGDVGVSPGSAVTDAQNITFTKEGSVRTTADSLLAQNAVIAANVALTGEACTGASDSQSLAGPQTITPGVYCYAAAAPLSGTVTLSGNGVFIFKTGTTLITATGATVALTNGAQACNVFWQVGSSATLFTNTTFVGNILADQSITLQNGATIIDGRALAKVGAVTMDTNTVHKPKSCGPVIGGIVADPPTGGLALQTDSSSSSNAWLLTGGLAIAAASVLALGGGAWYARRRRVQ